MYADMPKTAAAINRLAVETRNKALEDAATVALEQRCERGTPWDRACVAIAEKIRALKTPHGA